MKCKLVYLSIFVVSININLAYFNLNKLFLNMKLSSELKNALRVDRSYYEQV